MTVYIKEKCFAKQAPLTCHNDHDPTLRLLLKNRLLTEKQYQIRYVRNFLCIIFRLILTTIDGDKLFSFDSFRSAEREANLQKMNELRNGE